MRWMLGVTLLLLAGTAIGQDGSISRARFIADMDAQFRAMDSDRNGQLIAADATGRCSRCWMPTRTAS
jgi:hypothetical protein